MLSKKKNQCCFRYRYKEGPPINDRNRDRDFDRPPRGGDRDRGYSRDRDYNYYERDRNRWAGAPSRPPMQDSYYPPPPPEVHQLQPPPSSTRYSILCFLYNCHVGGSLRRKSLLNSFARRLSYFWSIARLAGAVFNV